MANAKDFLNGLNGTKPETRDAGLADVPPLEDKSLYKFLVSVRTWVSRATGGMASWDRLRRAGVVRHDEITGEFVAIGGRPSYVIPPAPTGLAATGAMTSILVTWNAAPYSNHAYTEVWAHTSDILGSAVLVDRTYGTVFAHSVGASQTRYYWIRNVTTSNVIGPFNATAGVIGVTSADPAALLSILTGQLSTTQLASALNTRINLIDAGFGTAGSVDARIKTETDARVSADGSLSMQISALAVSSDAGFDNVKIYYFDTTVDGWTGNGAPTVTAGFLKPAAHATDPYVISPSSLAIVAATYPQVKSRIKKTGTPTWEGRLYYQRTIDSTWDVARSVVISEPTYTSGIAAPTWDFSAVWSGTINQIRIDLSSVSDASNYFEIDWAAIGRSTPGASTAQITNIETAQIGYCSVSGVPNNYTTRATCEANSGVWNVGIPMATAVKQVVVNDGVDSVALEQRFVAQKTTDTGLLAQYTVKVNLANHAAGFGFATTAKDAAPDTAFGVSSNSFFVAPPAVISATAPTANLFVGYVWRDTTANLTKYWNGTAWTTTPTSYQFIVQTTPTTISGQTVPPGVYMDTAYIKNGSIGSLQVGKAVIDDGHVVNVTANKIIAGTITATFLNIGDTSFAFDAPNRIMRITDTQGSPKVRFTAGKIGAGAQDYGFAAYNADGSVLMSTGRAFDSTIVNAQATQGAIGLLSESWENPDVLTYWEVKQGAGELSIVTVSDSVAGGKILRIGNNVGNDESWMVYKYNLPFDSTKLYKVKIRARRTLGTGTLYVGFLGVGSDGSTIISATGTASYLTPCWHVAAAQSPLSSWTEYEGYTRGFGAPNGTATAGSISSPGTMHSSTRYIRPVILCNYSGATGTYEFDSLSVEEVPNAVDWTNNVTGSGKPENNATYGAPVGTLVGSTLSQTVEANAGTAFTETATYRTAGVPTNSPVPSFGQFTINTNGSIDVQVGWNSYSQGALPADMLIVYWQSSAVTLQGAPTSSSNSVMLSPGSTSYTIAGASRPDYYSIGIAAARRTLNGLEIGTIVSPSSSPIWRDIGGGAANYTGDINSVSAPIVALAAQNFNTRNDRIPTAVVAPAMTYSATLIDHTVNTDGSADVSAEWTWGGTESDIDGFIFYVHDNGTTTPAAQHTFTGNAETPGTITETVFYVDAKRRAFILKGVAVNHWYTFGVQAYRIVDGDIAAGGILRSAIAQTSSTGTVGEWTWGAYLPNVNVAFGGDINGTINGAAISNYANINVAIGSNGALSGAGGGQVTIGGLGYTGSLNADKTQIAIEGLVQIGDLGAIRNVGWGSGTKKISIDFANQQIAIGSDAWTGAAPTVPAIIHQYNGGTPRSYIGNGADKFVMFDGTDVKVGRDTKISGVDCYNNNSIYSRGIPTSLADYGTPVVTGTTSLSVTASKTLKLTCASSSSVSVSIARSTLYLNAPNFGTKRRRFKVALNHNSGLANSFMSIVSGKRENSSDFSGYFGFFLDGSTSLKCGCAKDSASFDEVTVGALSSSVSHILEADYFPSNWIKFYVDGSLVATLSTTWKHPVGNNQDELIRYTLNNSTFVYTELQVGESVFEQSE